MTDRTPRVMVFAGTTEGRDIVAFLAAAGVNDYEIGRASVGKECRSRWSPYH